MRHAILLTGAAALLMSQIAQASEQVSVRRPVVLYGGLIAADYASTNYALGVPGSRLRDLNPAWRTPGTRFWTATATAGLLTVADVQLQREGRRGWIGTKGLRVVACVVRGAAVGWNLRQGWQARHRQGKRQP